MAFTTFFTTGTTAGILLIMILVLYSLSRGICSVSAKDVLGKTISKSRRGRLMGWSASISGVAILIIGFVMMQINGDNQDVSVIIYLLLAAALTWLLASFAFNMIEEQAGATEGGGNALTVAIESLSIIYTDKAFREFVIARALLLSIAFTPPFYVLLAQSIATQQLISLGILIIASGLAAMLASPFWGYLSDVSSKRVMIIASTGAGVIGIITGKAALNGAQWFANEYAIAVLFFLLNIMHGGARLGRKVYLVDMATSDNRAQYVAISNTLIGIAMLIGGLIGVLAHTFGVAVLIMTLASISLLSTLYIAKLKDIT
jgi:MFS family permease